MMRFGAYRRRPDAPACDKADHLCFCETLAAEGGNVGVYVLGWLWNTGLVGLPCVHASTTEGNFRTPAFSLI
jgi:hypothetical protein